MILFMTNQSAIRYRVLELPWRLNEVMARRGVRSAAELHMLLEHALGPKAPSRVQVNRWVRERPERLGSRTLDAICAVLACTPSDLFRPHSWWALGSTEESVVELGSGGLKRYQPAGVLHAVNPDKIDISGHERPLAPCGADVIRWMGSSFADAPAGLPRCPECLAIALRHRDDYS